MSTTILTLEELRSARYYFDYLHDGIIDLGATLEGSNYGCPVEGTEEIREVLARMGDVGFSFLEDLDLYIEWKEKEDESR